MINVHENIRIISLAYFCSFFALADIAFALFWPACGAYKHISNRNITLRLNCDTWTETQHTKLSSVVLYVYSVCTLISVYLFHTQLFSVLFSFILVSFSRIFLFWFFFVRKGTVFYGCALSYNHNKYECVHFIWYFVGCFAQAYSFSLSHSYILSRYEPFSVRFANILFL